MCTDSLRFAACVAMFFRFGFPVAGSISGMGGRSMVLPVVPPSAIPNESVRIMAKRK